MIRFRNSFFGAAVFVVLVVFLVVPPAQALQKGVQTNTPEQRAQLKTQLEAMQAEIEANGYTFTIGPNPAMQYTLAELCSFKPDLPPPAYYLDGALTNHPVRSITQSLPASYTGYFTPVKNQESCGGGWAFGAIGLLEGMILKKDGIELDLSEQYMISCNPWGWGCNGGLWPNDMLLDPGAALESCMPYVAAEVPCNESCPTPYQVQSWAFITDEYGVPSITDIKQAIYTYGAVQAGVYVDTWFQLYTGGVFNKCKKKVSWTNHVVILCGWDDETSAWLLKNCWGTGWGENGFMWMTYGCNRVGEGANYFIY